MYTQLDLSKVISLGIIVLDRSQISEFFGLESDPILGIDIGSTAIKLMQLEMAGGQIRVQHFALEPLEPGVVIEKNIIDRDIVIAAIKAAYEKSGATTKKVCVSIPSSMSITRLIKMGVDLNDKDIGSEIELEAERYIPYKLNEINLDYKVVGPTDDPHLVNVMLVASKSENVYNMVNLIGDAGLTVGVVDIDCFAIGRAFELVINKLPSKGKGKVIALFDIGATLTTLNIFKDDKIIYTREQSFGSQQLVDEVQSVYGLTYAEAIQAMKYEHLPKDFNFEVLGPFKQTIVQQISRFCQFFFSSGDFSVIDYMFLTGGCSSIYGLEQIVQDKLQVKTFIADPFATIISPEIKAEASRLMKCCGLALRNLTKND